MTLVDDLTKEQQKHFCAMVDECILQNGGDDELKEGFRYLDELANYLGISFYDMVLQTYEKDELDHRIDEWRKDKGYM